jgi:hypothetical protein
MILAAPVAQNLEGATDIGVPCRLSFSCQRTRADSALGLSFCRERVRTVVGFVRKAKGTGRKLRLAFSGATAQDSKLTPRVNTALVGKVRS